MADIIVAHLDSDEGVAAKIAEVLQRNRWSVAQITVPMDGEQSAPDLELAGEAECLIAVWSPNALASASLQDAAAVAGARGRLVSVLRADARAPDSTGSAPVIDLTDWHADISIAGAFDEVIAAVQRVRGETVRISGAQDIEPTMPLRPADAAERMADATAEEAHWETITDSQDVWDFESFLEKYPNSHFSISARTRIKTIRTGASGGNTGLVVVSTIVVVVAVAIGIAAYVAMTWAPDNGRDPALVAAREPALEGGHRPRERPIREPGPPTTLRRPPAEGSGPSSQPERSGGPVPRRRPSGGGTVPPSSGSQVHECDRLTASVFDGKRKVDGVALKRIRADAAIAACRQAIATNPGEPRFKFQLGRAFYKSKRFDEAVPLFQRAAEGDYAVAMYRLGKMYQRGIGVEKDARTSVRWYRKAAASGNAASMNDLGWMYQRGLGVIKDLSEAARWYLKAAQRGMRLAMYNTGLVYANGRGVVKDQREAVRWYRKAADKGHVKAMYYLGRRYASARGVEKDDAEAMRWYRLAADRGHAAAFYSIGWMFEKGRSVGTDHFEAVRWFRKAAAKGNSSAMNALGRHYLSGKGVAKDASEALKWFRKAAEKGLTVSMNNVGLAYDKGRGTAKDKTEAVRWYQRAAKAGYAPGMHNLAAMYDDGTGVAKDPVQAARWVFEALKKGNRFTIKQMKTKSNIWSKRFRRDLQRRLREAGVYDGTIDGIFGEGVREAINQLVQRGK